MDELPDGGGGGERISWNIHLVIAYTGMGLGMGRGEGY